MTSSVKTRRERALLEDLRHAIHGLRAPFACGGTFVPEQPVTLCFSDKTQIPVLRAKETFEQERLLQPLVDRCRAAPFGMGRKTRYDRAVRDALQIKAEGGAFSVLNFDPAAAGILEQIRRELTPQVPDAPTAELYNLNVYATGGHFVPHKDTPRGGDMLGTLVVCLPSQFSNGAFVVKHHGIFQTYDWGRAIREQAEPTRIHWAAFFGDVDHQIERVWGGLRVTLTYLIRRAAGAGSETAPDHDRDTLNALVGQKLRRQTVSALKGRDYAVAAAALAEGLEVTLCPYMIETCADEAWQLDHFPTPREQAALGDRMDPTDLENALAIRASSEEAGDFDVVWVDPPPHFNAQPTMYPGIAEGRAHKADPDLPALAHLHACEYSATGYFGNEGSDIDLYVYGALHIAIPPYGEGARAVTRAEPSRISSSVPHGHKRRR